MRHTVAALAAIALLGAPAAATAKGVASASVCGADGCRRVAQTARFGADVAPARAPRDAEPFFTIRLRARVSSGRVADVYTLEWLPRAGLTRGYGERAWARPAPRLRRTLAAAARGLRPFPAANLEGPPTARVAEVFAPARDDRRTPEPLIAAGAAALVVAALFARRRATRR